MGTYLLRYRDGAEADSDPEVTETDITFHAANDDDARKKAKTLAKDGRAYDVFEQQGVLVRRKK